MLKNHSTVLYPFWSNASEYKETSENFDTIALQSTELHDALMEQWDNSVAIENVKLTSEQRYLCKAMGTKLPFLPFATEEENKLFAECALTNDFPLGDEEKAAVEWCKFVTGVTISPKLLVHIRLHKTKFERNRLVKDCIFRAREGQKLLDEFNAALELD